MEELDKILIRLEQVEKNFGTWGVIAAIALMVILVTFALFLKAFIQRLAESISEKDLKKFQIHVDKELVKFSTKHQKQIDAVHECYLRLQRLTRIIDYTHSGEKFTQQTKPQEEVALMVNARHEFKNVYSENRLLFSKTICEKIDRLIPAVDQYIEVYEGGLFDFTEEDIEQNAELNNGAYIAGIWSQNAFTDIVPNLKSVSEEIEEEFRKVYGTIE